jgi:hypothetical protein
MIHSIYKTVISVLYIMSIICWLSLLTYVYAQYSYMINLAWHGQMPRPMWGHLKREEASMYNDFLYDSTVVIEEKKK